jgi:xanthine dehydrogenase accessory factor
VELAMTCHSGGTIEVFIEPFVPPPYLIAAGDSPVARELIALGGALGFHSIAVGATANETHPTSPLDGLMPGRAAFVVVATMGVDDEAALLAALHLNPVYVALVGSRRRFETLADYLRTQGIDEERIAAIHAPAGLDIGAQTPPEIALSILAEIVQVRRELRAAGRLTVLATEPITGAGRIVIDPICGMEVDLAVTGYTLEINGEALGFCCAGCLRQYQQRLMD